MPRYFPDAREFGRIAGMGKQIVPVYRQLLADHVTPVTAFERLGKASHAFLLESVVGIEKIGRYSFIATQPAFVYSVKQGTVSLTGDVPDVELGAQTTDPLADLAKLLPRKRYHHFKELPQFTGGLVGYAGYDVARYYESEKLNHPPSDDRQLPDLQFGYYTGVIIFDHLDKTIKVLSNAMVESETPDGIRQAYEKACADIDWVVKQLAEPIASSLGEIDTTGPVTLEYKSNLSREQFEDAVSKGKQYIEAGDIFQFVPSQRLRVTSNADPLDVYRALRVINPSPFMFYLKSPECVLIGASPEILCRVMNGQVTSRPLAGTRKRGETAEEDLALEKELLADAKERAEHIMLVDLHRNDVGRVSKIGSVKVSDCMTVERYSHVMHITSNVTGELDPSQTALDALRVSLPVGTVSGAPKIRAMQIIDELEPTRRGPYGGAVGYLDFAGDMDTCIALRTIVHHQGHYDVQAGAGVVADSVPATEWEETMSKARALLKAVELAARGL